MNQVKLYNNKGEFVKRVPEFENKYGELRGWNEIGLFIRAQLNKQMTAVKTSLAGVRLIQPLEVFEENATHRYDKSDKQAIVVYIAYQDGADFYDYNSGKVIASYPLLVHNDNDLKGAMAARERFKLAYPHYTLQSVEEELKVAVAPSANAFDEESVLRGGMDEDFPRERYRDADSVAMDEAGHKESDFH
jgi:hypothetical protein